MHQRSEKIHAAFNAYAAHARSCCCWRIAMIEWNSSAPILIGIPRCCWECRSSAPWCQSRWNGGGNRNEMNRWWPTTVSRDENFQRRPASAFVRKWRMIAIACELVVEIFGSNFGSIVATAQCSLFIPTCYVETGWGLPMPLCWCWSIRSRSCSCEEVG